MPIDISYDSENDYIYTVTKGAVTHDDITQALGKLPELSREGNCRKWFNEIHEFKTSISIFDIYKFPRLFIGHNYCKDAKIALVNINSGNSKFIKLFEIISSNFGYNAKYFDNSTEATDWLNTQVV